MKKKIKVNMWEKHVKIKEALKKTFKALILLVVPPGLEPGTT